jgi:hypothetical protein
MKQRAWLTKSEDPYAMLNHLGERVSRRKAMLFACACVRRKKPALQDWEQQIVDVAERYADGLATEDELKQAQGRSIGVSGVAWVVLTKDYWAAVEAARFAGEDEDEAMQCAYVRDVCGNPYRRVRFAAEWRTDAAVALAKVIYEDRDFEGMPLLGDALEDAGCVDVNILDHCRVPGPHIRGCWVVDLVLGKQ